MIVDSLKLINFRNYNNVMLFFDKGINYIYGLNATGKTSLVEAIYFLSIARSFRTNSDNELINYNSDHSNIIAKISVGDTKKLIEIYLSGEGKKIVLNQKQVSKLSELSNIINAIYFIPTDVNLLKDSPRERRLFLNLSISKVSKTYLEFIGKYERLLRERNELLKQTTIDRTLLMVITKQIVDVSEQIYIYRSEYITEINKRLPIIYKMISGDERMLSLVYLPFINSREKYKERAQKEYENSIETDIKKKQTTKGIHREDFCLFLGEKDVGLFGSQGENRIAVLSLKLCPYELVSDDKLKPIVILDDVFSELDELHQMYLIDYLARLNQVFITNTKKIGGINASYYLVSNKEIVKEQ